MGHNQQGWWHHHLSAILTIITTGRLSVAFVLPFSVLPAAAVCRTRIIPYHPQESYNSYGPCPARAVSHLRPVLPEKHEKESADSDDDDGKEPLEVNDFQTQKEKKERQHEGVSASSAKLEAEIDHTRTKTASSEGGVHDAVNSSTPRIANEKSNQDTVTAARDDPSHLDAGPGLGLEGGIFPSDVSTSSLYKDITLQGPRLTPGQPEAMVGFWQLYGATGNREDIGGRIILRADGQVVGGPVVAKTPDVKWSDEEGLKPVGGRWEVYVDEHTDRTRLRFTIVFSFHTKTQLELDGAVMMINERDVVQPHVFGVVDKRVGEERVSGEPGDFSMMKIVVKDEDVLHATVGSQPQRIW